MDGRFRRLLGTCFALISLLSNCTCTNTRHEWILLYAIQFGRLRTRDMRLRIETIHRIFFCKITTIREQFPPCFNMGLMGTVRISQ